MKKFMETNKKLKIGVICGILVLALIVAIVLKQSAAASYTTILRNQVVDGISFENARIDKEDGKTVFTVDLYNENLDKYDIKDLTILFKRDNKKDVRVYLDSVNSLESYEGRQISVYVKEDIVNCSDIEYIINK